MAAMKSWWVTVLEGAKTVYQRKCISPKEATERFKALQAEYPDKKKYSVLREYF